jgi:hypothetical protein
MFTRSELKSLRGKGSVAKLKPRNKQLTVYKGNLNRTRLHPSLPSARVSVITGVPSAGSHFPSLSLLISANYKYLTYLQILIL